MRCLSDDAHSYLVTHSFISPVSGTCLSKRNGVMLSHAPNDATCSTVRTYATCGCVKRPGEFLPHYHNGVSWHLSDFTAYVLSSSPSFLGGI
ncbi:unnamed protein product [Soboliphyme baturini]|uniref:Secreted protein n=1 Tax=Soboliphyme baturini TaxID=241478 RepID=A0A183IJR7_9BILA|nr:unnamed protein product [Soboliphyme baturini]